MAPTAAAALASWEAAIAALEGLSGCVVCGHGPVLLLDINDAVFVRCKAAIVKVEELPKLPQGTWETIIRRKVGVASKQSSRFASVPASTTLDPVLAFLWP